MSSRKVCEREAYLATRPARGSLRACSSPAASIRGTSRTPTSSATSRAAPRCSSTRARRSSRCFAFAREHGLTPTHVLRTHSHGDHVVHEGELGLPVVTGLAERRRARDRGDPDARATPTTWSASSSRTAAARSSSSRATRSSRTRSAAATSSSIKRAVMDVYMAMPHSRRLLPGHTDESTIGREWEENPFVRVWRGAEPEGTERVTVRGRSGDARSSGAPTTTARARPGCASRTAPTRSSAAPRSSARRLIPK